MANKIRERERDFAKDDSKTTAPREMLCQDLREKTSIGLLPCVENITYNTQLHYLYRVPHFLW